MEVLANGTSLGKAAFDRPGWQTVTLPLPPGEPGRQRIELRTTPEFRPASDPRVLGIPIGALGFK